MVTSPSPVPPSITTSRAGIQSIIRAGRGPLRTAVRSLLAAVQRQQLAEPPCRRCSADQPYAPAHSAVKGLRVRRRAATAGCRSSPARASCAPPLRPRQANRSFGCAGWPRTRGFSPELLTHPTKTSTISGTGRPSSQRASSLSDLGPGFIIGLVELRRSK